MIAYAKLTVVEERLVQSADGNFRFIESEETGTSMIFPSRKEALIASSSITEDRYVLSDGVYRRKTAIVSDAFVSDGSGESPDDPLAESRIIGNRTRNILRRIGIGTLRELSGLTEAEAFGIRHVGIASMAEMRMALASAGLSFKEE